MPVGLLRRKIDSGHTLILRGPGVDDWSVAQHSIAAGCLSEEDLAMKANPAGFWREHKVDFQLYVDPDEAERIDAAANVLLRRLRKPGPLGPDPSRRSCRKCSAWVPLYELREGLCSGCWERRWS